MAGREGYVSIVTMEHPDGPQDSPSIPPIGSPHCSPRVAAMPALPDLDSDPAPKGVAMFSVLVLVAVSATFLRPPAAHACGG